MKLKKNNIHPLVPLRDRVDDLIKDIRREAKIAKQMVKVDQYMKIDGDGNTASQGDINIYLIQQEVLIGLYDIKDNINNLINNGTVFLDNLNLMELCRAATDRALEITNNNNVQASKLLGVNEKTVRNYVKGRTEPQCYKFVNKNENNRRNTGKVELKAISG